MFCCDKGERPDPKPLLLDYDFGGQGTWGIRHKAGYWAAQGNVNSIVVGSSAEEFVSGGKFYKWYWRKSTSKKIGSPRKTARKKWKLFHSGIFLGESESSLPLMGIASRHAAESFHQFFAQ